MVKSAQARVNGWTGQLRRVLLAGVGVAFLAKGEVKDLVDRLVEKGENAERDGRQLVSGLLQQPTRQLTTGGKRVIDLLERRTRSWQKNVQHGLKNVQSGLETSLGVTRGLAGTLQTRINKRIETVLHTMNLVSKNDVEDLNDKIDQLSRKLDRLGKK